VTLSKIYRAKAAALAEQAKTASIPVYKQRFEKMAVAYERLAEKYAKRLRLHENKPPRASGPSKPSLKIKNPKAPAATRAAIEVSKTSA
jgi:hypothetical protein